MLAMPPCRGVLDHAQSWRTGSDAPCRAPRRPGNPGAFEEPEPLPPAPRQGGRLSRPRAPSLDKCSLEVAFAIPRFAGSPPPISRLCRRRSGFRRSFAPSTLSRGEARPVVASASSSLVGAMGRTPPVDFCNRYDLRAQPQDAPNSAGPPRRSPTAAACSLETDTFRYRARAADGLARRRAGPAEMSWARGLVRGAVSPRLAPSTHDRSRWKLRPNPIGSDTPCRRLVASPTGEVDDDPGHDFPLPRLRTRPANPTPAGFASRDPLARCPLG